MLHTSASLHTGQYVTPSTRIRQFSQGRNCPTDEYTAPSNTPTTLSKPESSGVGTGVLAEIQTFHFTCERSEKMVALGEVNSTVDGVLPPSSYSSARPANECPISCTAIDDAAGSADVVACCAAPAPPYFRSFTVMRTMSKAG